MKSWKLAKHILIYGYAREGRSSARFLRRTIHNVQIDIYDAKIEKYATIPDFKRYDVIVVSSGIDRRVIPRKYRNNCINIVELFFDSLTKDSRNKIIGVTGTKGKSTTVTFISECLNRAGFKAISAGNIGVPVLEVLSKLNSKKIHYVVLELSSYQLEFLRVSPKYAIFLNLFQDHLDRHGNMDRYYASKQHLWKHQHSGDLLVVPARWKSYISPHSLKQRVVFSRSATMHMFQSNSVFRAKYWLENFGAAIVLLKELGVNKAIIAEVANGFKGLPHRLEYFITKKQIQFYDDSIAVNVDATMAGIKFLEAKLGSVVIGGYDRGQDFMPLIRFLVYKKIFTVVLKSQTSERLEQCFKKLKYKKYEIVDTMKEAVRIAFRYTKPYKACVLSCAAPSFDAFKNFEDRGEQFKKLVREYK